MPVAQGQTFVVDLEYLNQTDGSAPFGPDAAWDADGCQAGRNTVDVMPGGWSGKPKASVINRERIRKLTLNAIEYLASPTRFEPKWKRSPKIEPAG